MPDQQRPRPPLFSQIDVTHNASAARSDDSSSELTAILREMLAAQDRQNELLEELVHQLGATQRQRASELGMWKQANPDLARDCRMAAEALSSVQTEYLANMTAEINENFETFRDGEFMMNEFVDRFGPRMAHLNGLLQVLSQLSSSSDATGAPNRR